MIRTSSHASRSVTRTAISPSASDGPPPFPSCASAPCSRHPEPIPACGPSPSQAPALHLFNRFLIASQFPSSVSSTWTPSRWFESNATKRKELGFHARPFVLCGIPLRRPPAGQLVHRRRNGKLFLEMTAHPDFGLPFGQDRLIPVWVATLAVKQKRRTVHFESAAEILEFFELPKDGLHYRRLVQGFQRIFAATIFFGTQEAETPSQVFDWARFHFFDRAELWFTIYSPTLAHRSAVTETPSHSVKPFMTRSIGTGFLSNARQSRPCPTLQGCSTSMRIVWKTWTLKGGIARIPLFGAQGLQAQLGTADYSRNKRSGRLSVDGLRELNSFGRIVLLSSPQTCDR
jgi:hypothetical protein